MKVAYRRTSTHQGVKILLAFVVVYKPADLEVSSVTKALRM